MLLRNIILIFPGERPAHNSGCLYCFRSSFLLGIVCGFLGDAGKMIGMVCYLAVILPVLGIQARRLRDGGFTPWLLLLGLIPGIGGLILLILYVLPSKN